MKLGEPVENVGHLGQKKGIVLKLIVQSSWIDTDSRLVISLDAISVLLQHSENRHIPGVAGARFLNNPSIKPLLGLEIPWQDAGNGGLDTGSEIWVP